MGEGSGGGGGHGGGGGKGSREYGRLRACFTALGEIRGLAEVAEWVAGTDAAGVGAGGEGAAMGPASWLRRYLPALVQGGLTTLALALRDVEESGDLRQLNVDKAPARALFDALQVSEAAGAPG